MTKEYINKGVLKRESEFSIQSSSSIMKDNDRNLRLSYDADDSSSMKDPHLKLPHAHNFQDDTKCSSDTDVDYYMMKSQQRKGKKEGRPSKIEFQMVNQRLREKIRREKFRTYGEHYVHSEMPYFPPAHQVDHMNHMKNNFIKQQNQQQGLNRKTTGLKKKFINFFSCIASRESEKKRSENGNFYYFDHGENEYLRTTDNTPHLIMDEAAEHVSLVATKFWAEFFGSINVGVTFFIVFFLQLYRFILYSILRSIIVGFLQMTSDYFVKPTLTALFNGAIQPVLLLVRNILQSVWSSLEPLAQMILGFCIPFIECLRAIRLVDVNVNNKPSCETFNRRCCSNDCVDV